MSNDSIAQAVKVLEGLSAGLDELIGRQALLNARISFTTSLVL